MSQPTGIFPLHILIVDDHPNTATMLARAISQMGPLVKAVAATSGREALEHVHVHPADILITDMIMPEMNGLELIEKLQEHSSSRPVHTILITAYDVPGLKETARRLKINEIIAKPVSPERICQIVEKILKEWEQTPRPSDQDNTQRPFKILVADDLPDNVTLISRYLKTEGYDYITAADGVEVLQRTREHFPDLILLDVNMPKKDGFAVLEEVRADPAIQHIPVIILTAARLEPADIQSGFNLGADDYITKPFDRRELMARIRTKLRVKQAEDVIRHRNKELSLLPEIGRDLSARLEVGELADVVLRRTVETLGAMFGYIFILDSKTPLQRQYSLSTPLHFDLDDSFLNDLLDDVKQTQQNLIINDARTDPRWHLAPNDPTRSVIIVPMFGRLSLIGLLILTHEQQGYFNLEHQLLIQAIASQASIAIENAQLFSMVAQEQQRVDAVLQSAADAILMFDSKGCLSLLNPAAQKLFTDYEVKLSLPLERGRGYDAFIDLLEQALTRQQPISGEFVWPDQRVFTGLFTPIEKEGCVALLHDVSHFKALERVKDEFISTASHDLKSPITVITGFSQLLSSAGPLNEKQTEFAGHIYSAAQNMSELVQNLLDLAKIDMDVELKQDLIDLNALVFDVINEFRPQAETKHQVVQFGKITDQPKVQGDALQLKQALRNLIGNAIKYTPVDGSVEVQAETNEDEVKVFVKDTGYGIPAEDIPFIFDRFYRVHNEDVKNIEGNGLGLAIVKAVAERHGGQVNVESEPGKGSCFTLTLPLVNKIAERV